MSSLDTSKRFYFMTRTAERASDYHAFTDGGATPIPPSSYNDVFLRKAQLYDEGDEQPCASFYEESGKIYLTAAALMCGTKDAVDRRIRLSFCRIFQKNSDEDKLRAYAAFKRLARSWGEVEEKVRTFLEADHDNEMHFDDDAFMNWLENAVGQHDDFVRCSDGDIVMPWAFAWPLPGCVLKWRNDESDDAFYCLKKGKREGMF